MGSPGQQNSSTYHGTKDKDIDKPGTEKGLAAIIGRDRKHVEQGKPDVDIDSLKNPGIRRGKIDRLEDDGKKHVSDGTRHGNPAEMLEIRTMRIGTKTMDHTVMDKQRSRSKEQKITIRDKGDDKTGDKTKKPGLVLRTIPKPGSDRRMTYLMDKKSDSNKQEGAAKITKTHIPIKTGSAPLTEREDERDNDKSEQKTTYLRALKLPSPPVFVKEILPRVHIRNPGEFCL